MSAGLVGYVWLVNDDFPMADDWHLVPVYTGHQPVNLAWLWSQYSAHRLPLPQLLLVLGGAVTGHDYRTGVLLSALVLAGLAGLMIVTAGRLRGGVSLSDAFFPLALLHWGQSETLLIGFALNLVASTALSGMALLLLVRASGAPTLRQGLLFGLCLLALPLCGSNGAALVPPLAAWLAVAGLARWRCGGAHGRRDGAALLALALASAGLLAAYLLSLKEVPGTPPRAALFPAARTALEFLAGAFGPFAKTTWPLSGAVVAALALATVVKLAHDVRRVPAQRLRALGFLCFGAAMLCLAASIGWGRGVLGSQAGFETRYAAPAVPALCLAYFVGREAPRPLIARGLFVLMAALLVVNTGKGLTRAAARRERMRELQADVARGLTPAEMAKKWGDFIIGPGGEAALTERFEMLRQARQGPYAGRRDD
jgi:hypothetical protein